MNHDTIGRGIPYNDVVARYNGLIKELSRIHEESIGVKGELSLLNETQVAQFMRQEVDAFLLQTTHRDLIHLHMALGAATRG